VSGSFLYPNTIKITRPKGQTDVGAVPYGGLSPKNEALIAEEIDASVQMRSSGSAPSPGLPGDASKRTYWKVLIPRAALDDGTVQRNDIVTDECRQRYQVIGPYWTSLGYNLLVERLEV
jgi:hypothetical protein